MLYYIVPVVWLLGDPHPKNVLADAANQRCEKRHLKYGIVSVSSKKANILDDSSWFVRFSSYVEVVV